jgi:hypothetical protein
VKPGHQREILERTVRAIAERAQDAYRLVGEAHLLRRSPRRVGLVAAAKRLRMELLQTKGKLEREFSGGCSSTAGGATGVHWVSGVGPKPVIGRIPSHRRMATIPSCEGVTVQAAHRFVEESGVLGGGEQARRSIR